MIQRLHPCISDAPNQPRRASGGRWFIFLHRVDHEFSSLESGDCVFATPTELAEWVAGWITHLNLDSVLIKRHPASLLWHPFSREEGCTVALDQFDELLLDTVQFDTGIQDTKQLLLEHPNRLEINLPKLSANELRQATIGSVAEETSYLRLWKSVVRDIIAKTTTGMVGVNPQTNATRVYPSVRYTAASEALCRQGLLLRPFIGDMTFQIETPDRGRSDRN